MHFPEVDQYISKFEDLASLAGYTVGNEETINFFLRGLPNNIMTDVLKPPIVNTYPALKVSPPCAVTLDQSWYLLDNELSKEYRNDQRVDNS
jgi:hypothetical protein